MEQTVLAAGSNKKLILVLNKIGMLFHLLDFLWYDSSLSLRFSPTRKCREMAEVFKKRVPNYCF